MKTIVQPTTKHTPPTESDRFQTAIRGLKKTAIEADARAERETTEAATVAALTLRRRTEKAERLFESYSKTLDATFKHRKTLDAANKAYESEVDRYFEQIAAILPDIDPLEARRLIGTYAPMVEIRRNLSDAIQTGERLGKEKLLTCRELWTLLETSALTYCGSFDNLMHRGAE